MTIVTVMGGRLNAALAFCRHCQEVVVSQQSDQIEGSAPSPSDGEKLEGIGGWLVLLAISQVGGVLVFLMSIIANFSSLPAETATVQPAAFLGALVIEWGFLILLVCTAFLFFTKSRRFPMTFVVSCVAGMVQPIALTSWIVWTTGVDILSYVSIGDVVKEHLPVIAGSILWIAYVLNSVRVRNTFIR